MNRNSFACHGSVSFRNISDEKNTPKRSVFIIGWHWQCTENKTTTDEESNDALKKTQVLTESVILFMNINITNHYHHHD